MRHQIRQDLRHTHKYHFVPTPQMNKTPEGLAAEMQHREQVIRKLYNLVTEHHEDSVMRDEHCECPVCLLPEHRRLMQEAWDILKTKCV